MTPPTYKLNDLAGLTGIEPRTIRSYVQLGLLPGPEGAGRGSYYGPHHLERLQALLALKNQDDLSLADIRRRFLTATSEEIRTLAARLQTVEGAPPPVHAEEPPVTFVRKLRRRLRDEAKSPQEENELPGKAITHASMVFDPFSEEPVSRVAAMRMPAARDFGDRRQRGPVQEWLRFEITPDVEVHVRGPIEPQRRAFIEKLVARFRKMVLGGDDDGSW